MFEEYKQQARSKIQMTWKDIAQTYTLGWAGPLAQVERMYPVMTEQVASIRQSIGDTLPFLIFQTRESPPKAMTVAVPFSHDRNPYNCRIVASKEPTPEHVLLLNDFAQAVWFLIGTREFPRPSDSARFREALLKLTGRALYEK